MSADLGPSWRDDREVTPCDGSLLGQVTEAVVSGKSSPKLCQITCRHSSGGVRGRRAGGGRRTLGKLTPPANASASIVQTSKGHRQQASEKMSSTIRPNRGAAPNMRPVPRPTTRA